MTTKLFSEKKVGGLIAILIGFLSVYEAKILYPFGKNLLTGDHAFPGLIGVLLVLFGLSLFFDRKIEDEKTELPTGKTLRILFSSIFILVIYSFLITFIGYAVSTLVISICFIKVIGNKRWSFAVLTGVAITAVLYLLFIVLLKTPLPNGYFSF
jgi:magnesium-transporting ATPase (P-type)